MSLVYQQPVGLHAPWAGTDCTPPAAKRISCTASRHDGDLCKQTTPATLCVILPLPSEACEPAARAPLPPAETATAAAVENTKHPGISQTLTANPARHLPRGTHRTRLAPRCLQTVAQPRQREPVVMHQPASDSFLKPSPCVARATCLTGTFSREIFITPCQLLETMILRAVYATSLF